MSQIELSYEETVHEMTKEIQKHEFVYFATSARDYVRAGKMRLISNGLKLYCFTDRPTRKYKQMMVNPNVAIVANSLQIEGVVTLRGHPLDEVDFLEAYSKTQPEAYEKSSKKQFLRARDICVIEITPRRIATWRQGATVSESYFDILNTVTEKAYRIMGLEGLKNPAYSE